MKTVAAVIHWNRSTTACACDVALAGEDVLGALADQVGAEQQVARAEGVPLAGEQVGDPVFQGVDVGRLDLVGRW